MICIIDSAGYMPMRTDSIPQPRHEVKYFAERLVYFDHYAVTYCTATI